MHVVDGVRGHARKCHCYYVRAISGHIVNGSAIIAGTLVAQQMGM